MKSADNERCIAWTYTKMQPFFGPSPATKRMGIVVVAVIAAKSADVSASGSPYGPPPNL
jgi:hypothetical protein